jgi:hypothetical protein
MSGSQPSNNQAVQFEQEQASEADAKEAQRQQRLTQGQQLIDQIFNGQPVMGPQSYDWSTFNPTTNSAMAMWESQNPSAPTAGASTVTGDNAPAGYTAAQKGGQWGLVDASGNFTAKGSPLTIQAPTGKTTGGFDDAFYNDYKQKVLDYYQPDEQRQYDAAQRDLTYSLARAGTLQSSTAADKQGELAYNDALQKANIVANANTQEGNLKSQIQSNKQSLINQLYSTEDPTLTANLAESSAAASRLQDPMLTPAAALFTPALTTVGSAVNGLLYPGQQYPQGTAFNTAPSSPTPSSASDSRGKVVGV